MSTRQDPPSDEQAPTGPAPEVVKWMAFLAGHPLDERDRTIIAEALADEGPLAELTAIEARRTLRILAGLDPVGQAHSWLHLRTTVHRSEVRTGLLKRAVLVLHRRDPVVVPPSDDRPVITERSIGDWATLRTLVAGLALPADELDRLVPFGVDPLRASVQTPIPDDLGVIEIRRMVAQAPIARAAIARMLADPADTARLRCSMAGLDVDDTELVDRQIVRLWTVAELRRLDRTLRPVAVSEADDPTITNREHDRDVP